jgi:hypothetical protein
MSSIHYERSNLLSLSDELADVWKYRPLRLSTNNASAVSISNWTPTHLPLLAERSPTLQDWSFTFFFGTMAFLFSTSTLFFHIQRLCLNGV